MPSPLCKRCDHHHSVDSRGYCHFCLADIRSQRMDRRHGFMIETIFWFLVAMTFFVAWNHAPW